MVDDNYATAFAGRPSGKLLYETSTNLGKNLLDTPGPPGYADGYWAVEQFEVDGPGWVWKDGEPPMPKIDDTLLKSVVYLFGSVDDAQDPNLEDPMRYPKEPGETDAKAASGCLVEVHTKSHRHQYVVTNRHVIQAGLVFPRFSFVDGDVKHGYVLNCVQDDWQYDILKTDLAILPVRDKKVEVVKGIILMYSRGPVWPPVDLSEAVTDRDIGDDVVMIGRFYPASGGGINEPVARFGNVATWPARKISISKAGYPLDSGDPKM